MALPLPILSFFAHLLSKDSSDPLPGNEIISHLAVSCGSVEEGARVAQSLRDSGVLRTLGARDGTGVAVGAPFDPAAIYSVVAPDAASPAKPDQRKEPPTTPLSGESHPSTSHSSPALGRSSLSLSLTRSASRDAEGATTSAGVVRLLASSALAGGLALTPRDASEAAPTSAGLVAALVQAPLLVSASVPSAARITREPQQRCASPVVPLPLRRFAPPHSPVLTPSSDSKDKAAYTAYSVRVRLLSAPPPPPPHAAAMLRDKEAGDGEEGEVAERVPEGGGGQVWTVHRRFHEFR